MPPEERFPLLMLFFDETGKSNRKSKPIFIDRSRYRNIASGATSVITDWPSHLTAVCVTMLLTMIAIFMLITILFTAAIGPMSRAFLPHCDGEIGQVSNTTKIYLAHSNEPLNQNELNILENVIRNYPKCQIEITIFHVEQDNVDGENTDNTVHKKRMATTASSKTIGDQTTTGQLLPNHIVNKKNKRKIIIEKVTERTRINNLNDLMTKYSQVSMLNLSTSFIFENSPLYMVYENYSPEMMAFAVRTLKLWDYGGISFAFPEEDNQMAQKIAKLIEQGYGSYGKLADGLVTIDEDGLHMETKTTCHAFFGEMIHYLRQISPDTIVKDVVKKTLRSFCNRGAVDYEYCRNVL